MVQADAGKEYYKDLDLQPDCSNEDIKKQFRKLALKYHPDRNPGHETEFNARFQAIQQAHEVLCDSEQRTKYDLSRKRGPVLASAFTRPTPPRRNSPFPDPGHSDFPPPPSRTRPRSDVPPTSNGGAQRYAKFANTPPKREATSFKQDAKARANIFNAWQNLNHAQKQSDQASSNASSGFPPRSAYEEVNRRPVPPRPGTRTNSFERANDLPYDRNSRYRNDTYKPPPVPPRGKAPTAKQAPPPPPRETSRERAPYMTRPTEKIYYDGDAIKRSKSVRDTSNLNKPPARGVSYEHMPRRASLSPSSRNSTSKPQRNHEPISKEDRHYRPRPAEPPRPFIYNTSTEDDDDYDSPEEKTSSRDTQSSDPSHRPKATPSNSWANRSQAQPSLAKSRSLEEQNARKVAQQAQYEKYAQFKKSDPDPSLDPNAQIPPMDRRASYSSIHDQKVQTPPVFTPVDLPETFNFQSTSPNSTAPLRNSSRYGAVDSAFPAAEWTRNFANQQDNWASQWANRQPGSKSPTRPPPNTRRVRTGNSQRQTRQSRPFDRDVEAADGTNTIDDSSSNDSDDDNAMDIDTPPPSDVRRPSVVVEDTTTQYPAQTFVQAHDGAANARRPSIDLRNANANADQSSSRSRPTTNISMKDFRHVTPLFGETTGAGINNMNDMSSSLPFPSQASPTHPSKLDIDEDSPSLSLPKPPKPPLAPDMLTTHSWNYYLTKMKDYIWAWNDFSIKMASQFHDRALQRQDMEKGPAGGMVEDWLGKVGETEQLGGWDSYVKGLQEDDRTRAYWNVANEGHMRVVGTHSTLRNKMQSRP